MAFHAFVLDNKCFLHLGDKIRKIVFFYQNNLTFHWSLFLYIRHLPRLNRTLFLILVLAMQAIRHLTRPQPWVCASWAHLRRPIANAAPQAISQAGDAEAPAAEQAKKRTKPKTLAEVAEQTSENGLGSRFTRLLWDRNGYDGSYWTINRVRKRDDGKICFYGRLTFRGREEPFDRRVKPANKRGWRFFGDESD